MTIIMRHMTASDDQMVHAWRTSEHVARWMHTTVSDDIEEHRKWSREVRNSHRCGYFVAQVQLMDGTLMPIGLGYITHIDQYQCRVGLYIAEDSVIGMGYGKQVLQWLTRCAFKDLGLMLVLASVKIDNEASRRIFEQCGYQMMSRTNREMVFIKLRLWEDKNA